jgi:hypothetical protein
MSWHGDRVAGAQRRERLDLDGPGRAQPADEQHRRGGTRGAGAADDDVVTGRIAAHGWQRASPTSSRSW